MKPWKMPLGAGLVLRVTESAEGFPARKRMCGTATEWGHVCLYSKRVTKHHRVLEPEGTVEVVSPGPFLPSLEVRETACLPKPHG